jgi:hypothetical protein
MNTNAIDTEKALDPGRWSVDRARQCRLFSSVGDS